MTVTNRLDGLAGGAAIKVPCRVATTIPIASLTGLLTIDSIVTVAGDRVLVKDQTDETQNGIWVADTGDWDRAKDFDGNLDVVDGTLCTVLQGTVNGFTCWRVVSSDDPAEIGSSDITFEPALFSDASVASFIQAGTGAVARTVQSKLRETVSVKDYGATGDGVTDDTVAIQKAFTYAQGTYGTRDQRMVYFPQGEYLISSTINVNIPTTNFWSPGIDSLDGQEAVKIKAAAAFPAGASMFKVAGGSPGVFFQNMRNVSIEGVSIADHVGIELENIGGFLIDNISFDKIKSAVRMTTSGGGFCEFNVLTNCRFGDNVLWWLEYKGDSSYNGSGLGYQCQGNLSGNQRCVKVTSVGGGNPHVYNAPFNVMVWGDITTILWEHGGSTPARLHGSIRYETGAAITLGTGATVQTFCGFIDGISVAPTFGTFNVNAPNGALGTLYGGSYNFNSGTSAGDDLYNTEVVSDVDNAVYVRKRYRGRGGSTQGLTAHDMVRTDVRRAGVNSGAAGGRYVIATSPNNNTTDATDRVMVPEDGGFALVDGIVAPATLAGWAKIYVDTSDGDLKIVFGDGTVKTIVTDT